MAGSEATASLALDLFGPMHVAVAGHPLPHLRSRKSLWLLALLTLRRSRPVEREWLAATLWPDADPDQALTSLRTVLSDVRKALGDAGGRLQSPNRHTLFLDLDDATVDVLAFDAAIKTGKRPALEQAVALYRGPLLEGCSEEWVGQERGAREQDCVQALQTLAEAARASGNSDAAIGYYRRAVGMDPWSEAIRRGLMQALAQEGDTNAALHVYRDLIELLRSDPKATPDAQTNALYTRLRTEARRKSAVPSAFADAPSKAVPIVTGYLPHPLTDLVGREDERLEVTERLRRTRLVTLTGPGGIGKTRLAIEVATEAAQDGAAYADGVWLVALEALEEGKRVVGQVAAVLGLQEEPGSSLLESVTEHLRTKRLLLVLDNCEHLLAASAQVAGHLLRECARVRILATSREALGVTGETAWSVPALTVPDMDHLPTGRMTLARVAAGYESVQLFVERAQAIQKTFALTGENALPVAQICVRLGGLPLAIELAAARVRAMTVAQIAARLDDHLSLLTGGSRTALSRQQTLRATLDWSYALLNPEERLLLDRLSVFAGGWTLEAAEGVCGGNGIADGHILDLLTSLAEKSLLLFDERDSEHGRYRLLEMVQQYARERLVSSGTVDAVRARHRDWFMALASQAEPQVRGPDQQKWLQRLETEHDNFRAALTWIGTDAGGVANALQMACALWWFWYVRGHSSEGRQHLMRVLNRVEAQAPTNDRAKALNGAGTLCCIQRDFPSAQAIFDESLEIFRKLGQQAETAAVLGNLGNIALEQGDYASAQTIFEESLEIFRSLNNRRYVAASLGNLGRAALLQGNGPIAVARSKEALSIFEELQDRFGVALTLYDLGCSHHAVGDYPAARTSQEEGLNILRDLKDHRRIALSLTSLGRIAHDQGDRVEAERLYHESLTISKSIEFEAGIAENLQELGTLVSQFKSPGKAARLWGAAEALRERIVSPLSPRELEKHNDHVQKTRMLLGDDAFVRVWTEGRGLTWMQATAYALEEHETMFSEHHPQAARSRH